MSWLVALKMEGRFAGAILTVVSLVGLDDGRKMSRLEAFKIFFSPPSEAARRSFSAILAHKFNFVESPARVLLLIGPVWSGGGCQLPGLPATGSF